MSPAALALLVILVGLAVAGAILLLAVAAQRDERDDVLLRVRAMGGAEAERQGLRVRTEEIRNPVVRWLVYQLWRAGIEIDPSRAAMLLIIGAVVVLLLCLILGVVLGVLATAIVALVAYIVITRRAAARRTAILAQMPEYLDHVLRALSAGNSLEESIAESARESRDPIRGLFSAVARQVRLGAPVEEALSRQARIHELGDLHVLAMAASVNRQYGGSLRRIVKSLIHAIRSRDAAARELRALTAETRMSAAVLVLVTLFLTAYVLYQNPDYYAEMWAETGTRLMLMASALLQMLGIAVIYRMVRSTQDAA